MGKWAFLGPGEEKIGKAAVFHGRRIYTGITHADAYEKFADDKHEKGQPLAGEGFVTSKGRYVGRQEAIPIAEKASQRKGKLSDKRTGDWTDEEWKKRKDWLAAEDLD